MTAAEIQAKAAIASALISSRAVAVPCVPSSGEWAQDADSVRLRELTDYIYDVITTCRAEAPLFDDEPTRLADPGPRRLHAVTPHPERITDGNGSLRTGPDGE